jgi:hypothetical protein
MKKALSIGAIVLIALLMFQAFPMSMASDGLLVDIDIDPDVLNLNSKVKWITCHIELGDNVSDVRVSSIMLNNTIPIDLTAPVEVGDYDNDTILDLSVGFNRTEVAEYILAYLDLEGVTNGNVTLTLTGEFHHPQTFNGSDIITVSKVEGDANCDGEVNLYDAIAMLVIYGCREGEPQWDPNVDMAPRYGVIDIYDFITWLYCYYPS